MTNDELLGEVVEALYAYDNGVIGGWQGRKKICQELAQIAIEAMQQEPSQDMQKQIDELVEALDNADTLLERIEIFYPDVEMFDDWEPSRKETRQALAKHQKKGN